MNCEKIQNHISAYLDGELDAAKRKTVENHIERCADCAKLKADFGAILSFCDETFTEDSIPPNSQALWCRINNIIETEIEPELLNEEKAKAAAQGWFSRFWNNDLELSTAQIATSVVGIALISSLLTVIGIRNFSEPTGSGAGTSAEPSMFEKVLAELGVGESAQQKTDRHIKEQKSAIEYWNKRVEARRIQWNTDTRDVFDRNLGEINKAVMEFSRLLEENPQDSISNEMLDSALREKMELLREFSEL